MQSSSAPHMTDPTSQTEARRQLRKTWKEIEDVKEQIQTTLDEIAKANASLSKLRTLEKELLEVAAATASSISPSKFQHIPIDIIGEIAGHLVAPPSEVLVSPKNTEGFWPLTYACQSWRAAILSLPWLWSSFSVTTNTTNPQLLSTVIQRTANRPLSIDVYLSSEGASDPIFSLLVKHSRRWKSIRLLGTTGPTPLLALRGRIPQLERLKLYLNGNEADPWHNSDEEQSIFEDAPKLIELKIGEVPFSDGDVPVGLRFPLHQLQRVRYSDNAPSFRLNDLFNFANVSYLHLDPLCPTPPLTGTVTIPRLASLKLERDNLSILMSLRLPSLKSLEVYYLEDDEIKTITEFLTAHSESFSDWSLNALSIEIFSLQRRLIDLLRHTALNNLHTLNLSWTYVIPEDDGDWNMMSDILALLIWTPPCNVAKLSPLASAGKPRWYWINVMPHLRNLTLAFSSSKFEHRTLGFMLEIILSRTDLDAVTEGTHSSAETAALDVQADAIEEISATALELTPARLQSFCIRHRNTIPDITMKDLGMLTEGKLQAFAARRRT